MINMFAAMLLAVAPATRMANEVTTATRAEPDGSRTSVHEIVADAPAGDVWTAISTAEGWKEWAAPVAWLSGDVLETSYSPTAVPGDGTTIRQLLILRVPGRILAFRTTKAPEKFPHFDSYKKVTSVIEVEPMTAARTRVRLTQVGYPNTDAGRQLLGFFREGNRVTLERLKRRFSKGPIDWAREPR